MIKVTTILGRELTDLHDETGEIPTDDELKKYDGNIKLREFESQKELDAYIAGIQDREEYADYTVKFDNLPPKDTVICTCCGSRDVACDASVNPNTGEVVSFADGAFSDGRCNQCGWVILSDKAEVLRDIDRKWDTAVTSLDQNPLYALCMVAYSYQNRDDTNESFETIIKLATDVEESEDDEIYYYCDGIDEFKKLVEPTGNADFVVIDICEFAAKIK